MQNESISVNQISPDRLEMKMSGGGCLALFGFFFFAGGIFLLIAAFQVIPFTNASEIPAWGYLMFFLMSLPFIGIGGWFLFGKTWVIFDRALDKVTMTYVFLLPVIKKERFIHEFNSVEVNFNKGDSDSADTYPVSLVSEAIGQPLPIFSSIEFPKSFQHAELLAKFLNVPLIDKTTDHRNIISEEGLKRSFKENIGKNRSLPIAMSGLTTDRIKLDEEGETLKITIPSQKLNIYQFAPLIVPAFFLFFFGFQFIRFFHESQTPRFVEYFFIGFALFMFVLLPAMHFLGALFKSKFRFEVVSINSHQISIEEINGSSRKIKQNISVKDIVGIDYRTLTSTLEADNFNATIGEKRQTLDINDPRHARWIRVLKMLVKSEGVMIKSRGGVYAIAQGLPDEEVAFIHAKIMDWLKRVNS